MRLALFALTAVLGSTIPSRSAEAQAPAKKRSRLREMAGKLVDTAATSAAAMGVDSLLGAKGRSAVAGLTGTGEHTCPAGTVPVALTAAGVPSAPTAGTKVVGVVKKGLVKKADSTPSQAAAQPSYTCQPVAAQAQTPGVPNAPTGVPMGALAAATPIGAAAALAPMAAPLAGNAAKAVSGIFNKPQTKVGMIKDLVKGRLELKAVKFVGGSDELLPGYEEAVSNLVEALQTIEGRFVLNLPAESESKAAAPDTVMARRRLQKLWGHLLVAGIKEDRFAAVGIFPPELDPKSKPPKGGDARVELVKVGADWKP